MHRLDVDAGRMEPQRRSHAAPWLIGPGGESLQSNAPLSIVVGGQDAACNSESEFVNDVLNGRLGPCQVAR